MPNTITKQPGNIYVFRYPRAFYTLPEYSSHRGQAVTLVRQLGEEESEAEMYEIVAADGWRGYAYADELE